MIYALSAGANHIPVKLSTISGCELLWRNSDCVIQQDLSDESFVAANSLLLTNTRLVAENRHSRKLLRAGYIERYGGNGIGCNGGGARVLNVGNVQLKGTGQNLLAGRDAPNSHSYGGLDIQGAVKEIIYSQLLQKISPVGSQPIVGLIDLMEDSAFHNGNPSRSVILVRGQVLRAAHWLPCLDFREKPEYKSQLQSDYCRLLKLYKPIARQSLQSEFLQSLQLFLERCADQLSFFRIARFSHNALAPSNLGYEGEVLDTALCSFVVAGSNYGVETSFLEEPGIPAVIAINIFEQLNKFTGLRLSPNPFLTLYEQKFMQYAAVNFGFTFALNRSLATILSTSPEWRAVFQYSMSLLSSCCNQTESALPSVHSIDFYNDLYSAALYTIYHRLIPPDNLRSLARFSDDLLSLLKIIEANVCHDLVSSQNFLVGAVIQIMKRLVASQLFFITYVGRAVDDAFLSFDGSEADRIIRSFSQASSWIFESIEHSVCTIFSTDCLHIDYSVNEGLYRVKTNGYLEISSPCPQVIDSWLRVSNPNMTICDFDFRKFVFSLFAFLCAKPSDSFNGVRNVYA